jgi:hypothetical protein
MSMRYVGSQNELKVSSVVNMALVSIGRRGHFFQGRYDSITLGSKQFTDINFQLPNFWSLCTQIALVGDSKQLSPSEAALSALNVLTGMALE